jgi:hypothetical protein
MDNRCSLGFGCIGSEGGSVRRNGIGVKTRIRIVVGGLMIPTSKADLNSPTDCAYSLQHINPLNTAITKRNAAV